MKNYLLDRNYAESLLSWAGNLNPGFWIPHSKNVALAAETIARKLNENGIHMDSNIAYICGLLHDFGRYKGKTPSIVHSLDGFRFLSNLGFEGNANVCMTHSFPCREFTAIPGWHSLSEKFREELMDCFQKLDWSLYDKIVLLSDALADEEGVTTIERRIVSAAIRNGVSSQSPLLWKGYYLVKNEIESLLECSIYSVLPRVFESIEREILLENEK